MQKIQITLLIILSSVFFSAGAIAQNQPLACQSDARGGLYWENGQWNVASFNARRFILVKTADGLTKESAGKALGTSFADGVQCRNLIDRISCSDRAGGYLDFNPKDLRGGIAQLIGASLVGDDGARDPVTVIAFSCTPF